MNAGKEEGKRSFNKDKSKHIIYVSEKLYFLGFDSHPRVRLPSSIPHPLVRVCVSQVEIAFGEEFKRLVKDNQVLKDELKQLDSKMQVRRPSGSRLSDSRRFIFCFPLFYVICWCDIFSFSSYTIIRLSSSLFLSSSTVRLSFVTYITRLTLSEFDHEPEVRDCNFSYLCNFTRFVFSTLRF